MSGLEPALMGAAMATQAGGTLLGAYGEASAANEQADALNVQRYYDLLNSQNKAKALNYAATTAMASAQRQAMDSVTDKKLALSKVQAVAAASGGGATDTTVANVMSEIEQQGEYNKAVALFAGETEMNRLNDEAQSALIEGMNVANARGYQADQVRRQGRRKAAGTLLSGAGEVGKSYTRYSNAAWRRND
jgi:hypothetical protein